jgi:hypothetical protein
LWEKGKERNKKMKKKTKKKKKILRETKVRETTSIPKKSSC